MGDKWVTNGGSKVASSTNPAGSECGKSVRSAKGRKSGKSRRPGPLVTVKFGSASVPVYRSESRVRIRFIVCSYRDGKRLRKVFNQLEEAKKEALFVAQRIQSGMQHVTDLKPHERDHYKEAVEWLDSLGIPRVAAVEDYVPARKLAEKEALTSTENDYRMVLRSRPRRTWSRSVSSALPGRYDSRRERTPTERPVPARELNGGVTSFRAWALLSQEPRPGRTSVPCR